MRNAIDQHELAEDVLIRRSKRVLNLPFRRLCSFAAFPWFLVAKNTEIVDHCSQRNGLVLLLAFVSLFVDQD